MNEKELEHIRKSRDDAWGDVLADIARQLTIANEYRESELTVGRAIVEALEHTVAIVDPKPERELARHQSCGCVLCFCYGDRCLGCGAISCGKDDCVLKTSKGIAYATPAPDALVETVKKEIIPFLADVGEMAKPKTEVCKVCGWREHDTFCYVGKAEKLLKRLETALAAHEKAVR